MIQMMVQVAAGSCDRHNYNEKTLEYLGTRPGSQPYPYPYGFIIGTSAEDGGWSRVHQNRRKAHPVQVFFNSQHPGHGLRRLSRQL